MKTFKNRYGTEYWFEKVNDNTFAIKGKLDYWRFGINDKHERTFADPSGGPFISLGDTIENKKVIKIISNHNNEVFFEVI